MSYSALFHLFLIVSITLTVINLFSAFFLDLYVGRMKPETVGATLTSSCTWHSGSSTALSRFISDPKSASRSLSLLLPLLQSPIQWGQISAFKMLSCILSTSASADWWSIPHIWQTFHTGDHHPWRFHPGNNGCEGNLLNNLNTAEPSYIQHVQDGLMISSVSERYPMAVICLFCTWDFFCIALRLWLPRHISK